MVEIVFIFHGDCLLRSESGTTVQRDSGPLQAGRCLIDTAGSLTANNEVWLVGTRFVTAQTPTKLFRDAVRERDY